MYFQAASKNRHQRGNQSSHRPRNELAIIDRDCASFNARSTGDRITATSLPPNWARARRPERFMRRHGKAQAARLLMQPSWPITTATRRF